MSIYNPHVLENEAAVFNLGRISWWHKRMGSNFKAIVLFAFLFIFSSILALSTPVVRLPVEVMEKLSTHIIILAPDKFTTDSESGRSVARYKYSAIKYLKGDKLESDLLIYDYPDEYGKLLTKSFTGNQDDSLPNGFKKEDCIDILFLYKDAVTGRLYWLPMITPNCFPLRKYEKNINSLQDLMPIAERTKDPCLIGFIASITDGSSDLSWRGSVDTLARRLGGGESAMLRKSLDASPLQGVDGSIEDLVPDIRDRKMKTLESSAKSVLSEFISAVLSGKIADVLGFAGDRGRVVTQDSEKIEKVLETPAVKRIINLGEFRGIEITSVKETGGFIEVAGTINGKNGPVGFTSSLLKDDMKITSLDITAVQNK